MNLVEATGKTIDEAIEEGLKKLNCQRENVEIEVVEEPSRGLFGLIGAKEAKVKLTLKDDPKEKEISQAIDYQDKGISSEDKKTDKEFDEIEPLDSEHPEAVAIEFLEKIFIKLDLKVKSEVSRREEFINISFYGEDLGILIGRRGETLDSLQYLTNLVVGRRFSQRYRIILDVEGYRKRREQTLINLALRLSEKVRKSGHNIVLEPMNPHERRIIHTALQNEPRVRTFSEGEEPYRKVVITKKNR